MGLPPPPQAKKNIKLIQCNPCNAVPCSAAPCSATLYAVQFHAVQPHAVQPHAVQYHAVQPHVVQPHAVQIHAVQLPPAVQPHAVQPHAVQPMQCSPMQYDPCICGVVSFEQLCPAYLFHVISISHGILANFWLMHVDLLIFKYNHTQFCFLAGILTNYYMMKHAVRLTCRLNL